MSRLCQHIIVKHWNWFWRAPVKLQRLFLVTLDNLNLTQVPGLCMNSFLKKKSSFLVRFFAVYNRKSPLFIFELVKLRFFFMEENKGINWNKWYFLIFNSYYRFSFDLVKRAIHVSSKGLKEVLIGWKNSQSAGFWVSDVFALCMCQLH